MTTVRPFPVVASFETTAPPAPFTADALASQQVPPRNWQVPGLIPGTTVTTIDGDGGTGKSTLGLQLGVATVLGKDWLNRKVRKGRVFYVSAEDDQDELHRRLNDMCVHFDCGLEDLGDLKLWPLDDITELVALDEQSREFGPTSLWTELERILDDWQPFLIVLDSRADVYGGDEVNRRQVRRFVSMLRQLARSLNAAVVMLSHPSLTGMSSGSGSSGSTAWNNSVRSRLYLSKPALKEDGDHDPDLRLLSLKKANYGPETADMHLYRKAGVFVTKEGATTTPLDRTAERNRIDELFLQILGVMTERGQTISPSAGANYAPAIFAKETLAGEVRKAAFSAAMSRLFDAKKIRIEIGGPPSRPRKQLVAVSTS